MNLFIVLKFFVLYLFHELTMIFLQHEDASVMMFDHMVDSNDLVPVFEKYGLGPADRTFVKEQIRGPLRDTKNEWKYEGRDRSKSFLYEVHTLIIMSLQFLLLSI